MNCRITFAALLTITVAVVAIVGTDQAPQCSMNGQNYDIGTMFDGTDAFYYCKRDGMTNAVAEPIGCINTGQRVYDLALYQSGGNYFRCRVGDTSVTADLWGCAVTMPDGTVQPKSIACTWEVGSDPINYVNCCTQSGGTAVVSQLYCLYSYRGGRIQVNAGCFRIFEDDGVAAGCSRNPDGQTLTMTTWPAMNADSNPSAAGLSEC